MILLGFSSCDREQDETFDAKKIKENVSNNRSVCATRPSKTSTFTWNMASGVSAVVTMCYVNRNGSSGQVVYWKFSNIIAPSNYSPVVKRKEFQVIYGTTSCTSFLTSSSKTLSSTLSPNTWYQIIPNNNETKFGLKALTFDLKLQAHFLIRSLNGGTSFSQSPTYTSPLYNLGI